MKLQVNKHNYRQKLWTLQRHKCTKNSINDSYSKQQPNICTSSVQCTVQTITIESPAPAGRTCRANDACDPTNGHVTVSIRAISPRAKRPSCAPAHVPVCTLCDARWRWRWGWARRWWARRARWWVPGWGKAAADPRHTRSRRRRYRCQSTLSGVINISACTCTPGIYMYVLRF